MVVLALGIALFAALHLVPAVPRLKAAAVAWAGQRAYGPLFGAASVLALALVVLGWRLSPHVQIYVPEAWGRYANFALTLVAFLCAGIFLFRGSLRQSLRFPMGIAVLFWGTGHLLANGDLRGIILFGGMMAYAALHIAIGLAQGSRPSADVRSGHDLLSLMAGAALYGMMTQLHPVLIGVSILPLPQ